MLGRPAGHPGPLGDHAHATAGHTALGQARRGRFQQTAPGGPAPLLALAPFGPISLVAFVLVTIGALALALTFGALSKRVPGSGGTSVRWKRVEKRYAGRVPVSGRAPKPGGR